MANPAHDPKTGEFTSRKRRSPSTKPRTARTKRDDSIAPSAKTIGAVAIGAGLGLAAALGRKVAVQAVSGIAGDWDQVLTTEHAMVAKLFEAIEATTEKNTAKRSTLLATLKHSLGKHAFAEENVIYPAIRDALTPEPADKLNHEHGYIKDHLYDLEVTPKNDPRWIGIARDLKALIEEHVREEEDEIFPDMKARLSEEQNAKLTAMLNKEAFKLA